MTRHRRLSWCAALFACLLAACSAERPPPSPATPAAAPGDAGSNAVECAHDIGGRPPDDDFRLVLDAVALPVGVLQTSDSGEPGRLFAKTGLLVRAGRPVELTVATPGAGIGWGSPGPEGTTIRVPACPSRTGWLAFAGGYTVAEPTCVALTVRVGDREKRAEVSVGLRC